MICKNGLKQYIFMGLASGALTAVLSYVLNDYDVIGMLEIGMVTGITIPLVMWVCDLYNRRCAREMRSEEARTHVIICEGWAQIEETDGWLFLTDKALEFYPYKKGEYFAIPICEVVSVSPFLNSIKVEAGEKSHDIHVNRPFLWRKLIEDAIVKNDGSGSESDSESRGE